MQDARTLTEQVADRVQRGEAGVERQADRDVTDTCIDPTGICIIPCDIVNLPDAVLALTRS